MKKTLSIIMTFIFAVLITISAAGQTLPPVTTEGDESERIEYIRTMLNETRFSNSLWWYGWMGAYTAASAVSFTIAAKSENDVTRITQTVSGIESVIGLAGVILTPMPPAYALWHLDGMAFTTQEEKGKKLDAAEGYLRETAQSQEFGSSWVTHALNFAVNASGGMVIWKGYEEEIKRAGGDPQKEGLVNFIVGFVIGEIQIFTQPTAGIGQWKSYREKYNITNAERADSVNVFVTSNNDGLSAGVTLKY